MNSESVLLFIFCAVIGKINAGPKLIVVLVDGVRWDYLDDPKLKGFRRIAETGVKASYVTPIFPSVSYPNWYTIVTGLYAENHGFVENTLYDNDTGSIYLGNSYPNGSDPMWWNEAEPIWITAEKNSMPVAMYWWGGCEPRIKGYHTTICERERFNPPSPEEKEDFLLRIDDVVQMFKPSERFPQDRLSLAMMYYGATDSVGHQYGPESKKAKEALYDIDSILDSMLNKLQKAGLRDKVNVMVVSDHGMTDISKVKVLSLEKFRDLIKYQVSSGSSSMIVPQDGKLDELYRGLKQSTMNGVDVYKKEDIPEKYHIKGNKRTPAIFLDAKKGVLIEKLSEKGIGGSQTSYLGGHGYDPAEMKDMAAIFLATGPDFPENRKIGALNMTDLYNVMCAVLNLQPLPNNGSWDKVRSILKSNIPSQAFVNGRSSAQETVHLHFFSIVMLCILCLLIGRVHFKIL